MTSNATRVRRVLPALALTATALLAGCGGPVAAQSAGIIGDSAVTANQLDAYVTDIYRALNRPVDEQDADVVRASLERLMIENLVGQAAGRLNVTVSQSEIDLRTQEYIAELGGRQQMEQAFLGSNIPPSGIDAAIRLSLLVPKIGVQLVPQGSAEDQQQALVAYMRTLAEEIGVEVNPRYGTWTPEDFTIGPLPDDLSTPAERA